MSVRNITPQHRAIEAPEELRRLTGWLLWRYEQSDGGKPIKVPYWADGGRRYGQQGSAEDRAKLVTFAAARDAAARRGFDGVGLAMLPDWNITALDFDHCVGPDGQLPEAVSAIAARTYAEYSPSGTGVRAFVRGAFGNRKSHADRWGWGFETFTSSGFVTFTGNVLPITEVMGFEDIIAEAPATVGELCEQRFSATELAPADPDDFMLGREPRLGLTIEQIEEYLNQLDPDLSREEWIRVGMAVHHETSGDDDGFYAWNSWSAYGDKYPSEDALRAQWESFTRRDGQRRRQVTMASVIKMVREGTTHVSADDLRAVMDKHTPDGSADPLRGVKTPEGHTGRYRIYSASEMVARKPGEWWIKDIIPDADLGIIFGASGAGKTFVAIDYAVHIALGKAWNGKRTRKGRVIIIAAEGGGAYGKRINAYCKWHNIDPATLDLGVITAAPNFLDREDISDVVAAIAAAGGADVIVVDTFAQVTPGANENAAEDMGNALANVRALREATGSMPILVHHAGKDLSRGSRGWSGLKAAVDFELEVSRHEDGHREIRTSKMKDGDDNQTWPFRLETVMLGYDTDGDEITSCVAVPADPAPVAESTDERKNVKRLGKFEAHVAEMIETVDKGKPTMNYTAFVSLCAEALPAPEDDRRDTRRQNVMRAIRSLAKISDAPLGVDGNMVVFYV